jgi:hypothetical protein
MIVALLVLALQGEPPPADDCAGVVNALQDDAIVNAGFVPATEGEISLP